jgi:hypothetical protein
MTVFVLALSRYGSTNVETENLKLLARGGAGLLVSILLAIYGPAADLTSGFF